MGKRMSDKKIQKWIEWCKRQRAKEHKRFDREYKQVRDNFIELEQARVLHMAKLISLTIQIVTLRRVLGEK